MQNICGCQTGLGLPGGQGKNEGLYGEVDGMGNGVQEGKPERLPWGPAFSSGLGQLRTPIAVEEPWGHWGQGSQGPISFLPGARQDS